MNNALEKFQFQSQPVRIEVLDGDPWFVLKDILEAMGTTTSPTDASASVRECFGDEVVFDYPIPDPLGRRQKTLLVSEAAATYLISRGNTPASKLLNRYIHTEVLPSIRREGAYIAPAAVPTLAPSMDMGTGSGLQIARQLVGVAEEHDGRIAKLEHQLEEGVMMKMPEEPDNGILFPRQRPGYMRIRAYMHELGMTVEPGVVCSFGQRISRYCRRMEVFYEKNKHGHRYPTPVLQEFFREWR